MAKNLNQRADVKNPNNAAFKHAADNRSVQLNTKQASQPHSSKLLQQSRLQGSMEKVNRMPFADMD